MFLLKTHVHKLVFKIDNDASEKFTKKWYEFKLKCENGNNKHIVEQIKDKCKLEINKNLPYLDRLEGGLGGNNNTEHKQIRFRHNLSDTDYNCRDNNIVFQEILSTNSEKWTYEELDDLIRAFVKTANNFANAEYVRGFIQMENYSSYSDNYLDSDSE